MDRYDIHNSRIFGDNIKMIKKNRKVIIQKTDQASSIPVFHLGNLSLDMIFWPGGGVVINSISYKKIKALYNIAAFNYADGNKPLLPEHFQTVAEFIFESYRKENSFNPSKFLVQNMTKRITECLKTNRVWIKKAAL